VSDVAARARLASAAISRIGRDARTRLGVFALLLAGLLVGCKAKPAGRTAEPFPQPDTALVATLGTLHLLEARQARFGDVPPTMREEAMAAHGFTEASLRQAVEHAQRDVPTWESLAIAVDAWLLDPAHGGGTQPDGVQENLGSPALPSDLQGR